MLQRLYLMCKAKQHKSQKHSSVFSNGSLNHSEDEKADTSLFSGAEWKLSGFRFFWLLLHLSSCDFCLETVGKGDIQLLSATVQCVLSSEALCLAPHRVWSISSWHIHLFMFGMLDFFVISKCINKKEKKNTTVIVAIQIKMQWLDCLLIIIKNTYLETKKCKFSNKKITVKLTQV